MSETKEKIIESVKALSEKDAIAVWSFISNGCMPSWDDVPVEKPDLFDLQQFAEMKNDPDCAVFVSAEEAHKMLGI